MLRVLDWQEQSCLTIEAQALIYEYRSKGWLTPQQLERMITETVIISQLRQFPGDVDLITSVLMSMGAERDEPIVLSSQLTENKSSRLLS